MKLILTILRRTELGLSCNVFVSHGGSPYKVRMYAFVGNMTGYIWIVFGNLIPPILIIMTKLRFLRRSLLKVQGSQYDAQRNQLLYVQIFATSTNKPWRVDQYDRECRCLFIKETKSSRSGNSDRHAVETWRNELHHGCSKGESWYDGKDCW
jgi:hypothetical protein